MKVVVRLPFGGLPGRAVVGRNLELSDGDVGVHDLHAEPVLRCAFFVFEDDGRSDSARDDGPRNRDDALVWVFKCLKGVGEEVEAVCFAAGTLIDNLLTIR